MTGQEIRRVLEADGTVNYKAWSYYKTGYLCDDGCCDDHGLTLGDVMNNLTHACDGDYEDVWTPWTME